LNLNRGPCKTLASERRGATLAAVRRRALRVPVATPIQPVLAKPFHRDGWVYEEKVDGWRMLAYKDGRHVSLVSRRGVDHTKQFLDIAAVVAGLLARTLTLTPRCGIRRGTS
jgi:bifunctional non-homologous end joining protein LigD